jgi:hypothetical protein
MTKPTGTITKQTNEDEIEGFQPRSDEELKKLRDNIETPPTNPEPDASSHPSQSTP